MDLALGVYLLLAAEGDTYSVGPLVGDLRTCETYAEAFQDADPFPKSVFQLKDGTEFIVAVPSARVLFCIEAL